MPKPCAPPRPARKSSWRARPSAARQDRLGEKIGIARVLADPSNCVRPPVGAEGKIQAHTLAAAHQMLGHVGTRSVEHLELVLALSPTALARDDHDLLVQYIVVRREYRIEPPRLGVP